MVYIFSKIVISRFLFILVGFKAKNIFYCGFEAHQNRIEQEVFNSISALNWIQSFRFGFNIFRFHFSVLWADFWPSIFTQIRQANPFQIPATRGKHLSSNEDQSISWYFEMIMNIGGKTKNRQSLWRLLCSEQGSSEQGGFAQPSTINLPIYFQRILVFRK